MKSASITNNLYYTHSNHLFSNPLCKEQTLLKKILNVAFHILTLGIPLAIYHIASCFHLANRTKKEGIDPGKVKVTAVREKIITDLPKSDNKESSVNIQTVRIDSVEQNKTIKAYSGIGQEALQFARRKLEKHPKIAPRQFSAGWQGPDKTNQPTNPEIALLTTLYWDISFKNFEILMKLNKENPWSNQEVIQAADECMKIGYAISNLTLDDLKSFTEALSSKGDNRNYAQALIEQDSYQYRTFYYCTNAYHWFRGEIAWSKNPHNKDKEGLFTPQNISEAHSSSFYKKGTIQNSWNALYNDYCDRVRLYVDEKELKLADIGLPAEACTLATALKALGYSTGQFGKNHLGDLNKYLPTLHGFDEFFGFLYHLDAMSDPYWFDYPQEWIDTSGPRNLVHSWATDVDDSTEQPRWGKIGKQKIVDEGPLAPFPDMKDMQNWQAGRQAKYDMETFDDVLVKNSIDFMDKAKADGKPFFIWHNTSRMHVFTYLPPNYQKLMNASSNYNIEEAGMAQLDDNIGQLLKHLEEIGEADNTIVIFTTDNGAEVFTWPDGGMTPFRATKGTVFEGGFRVPCIVRWPGKINPGTVENGIFSGLDWFPTLVAAAGHPNIKEQLLKGVKIGDQTYKNYLDGYNQLDLLLGKSSSARHEIFYFGGANLGAVRLDNYNFQFFQQPWGWPGEKITTDMPTIVNLRQDPFERTPSLRGESTNTMSGGYLNDFYARQFWRFVTVQKAVEKLALTAIDYPPMQASASFNLSAIKSKIDELLKQHEGQ